jgi:hypothetical protein
MRTARTLAVAMPARNAPCRPTASRTAVAPACSLFREPSIQLRLDWNPNEHSPFDRAPIRCRPCLCSKKRIVVRDSGHLVPPGAVETRRPSRPALQMTLPRIALQHGAREPAVMSVIMDATPWRRIPPMDDSRVYRWMAGALVLLCAGAACADDWRDIPYERFHRALTMVTPLPDARYVRISQRVAVPETLSLAFGD